MAKIKFTQLKKTSSLSGNNEKKIIIECPLVLFGPLYDSFQVERVQKWLDGWKLKGPVIIEGASNIKPAAQNYLSDEKTIRHLIDRNEVRSVIKIGSTPTSSLWRDIDDKYESLPVYNFYNGSYPGLARQSQVLNFKIEDLEFTDLNSGFNFDHISSLNNQVRKEKNQLLQSYPLSEVSWFHRIRSYAENKRVYLGNSLPIRYWDFVEGALPKEVWANRGANGIDGQISSFLGWVLSHKFREKDEFVGIFGDLTAFYDLQALWIYHQFQKRFDSLRVRIIIVNNQGGQIFSKVLADPFFINQHALNFKFIAEMFQIPYDRLFSSDQLIKPATYPLEMIEVLPDSTQQASFDMCWSQQ